MDTELSKNPLADDVNVDTNPSTIVLWFRKLKRLFEPKIDTRKPRRPEAPPAPPKKKHVRPNKIAEYYKNNDEALANLRRVAEIKRQARRVRSEVKRDMGTILRDADERRREARKAVQMAIRRSAPWVGGPPSPFE